MTKIGHFIDYQYVTCPILVHGGTFGDNLLRFEGVSPGTVLFDPHNF